MTCTALILIFSRVWGSIHRSGVHRFGCLKQLVTINKGIDKKRTIFALLPAMTIGMRIQHNAKSIFSETEMRQKLLLVNII